MRYTSDLHNRLLNFAVTAIKFLTSVPHQSEYDVIIRQLSKSASSIGANLPCEISVL